VFKFNYLSATGTATILAVFLSLPLIGLSFSAAIREFFSTVNKLKFAVVTVGSVLGFAYLTNSSSMSYTMAMALANTGILFPFFSPVLGWLGVFLTGSDTSANALFCKLQADTAHSLGIDPIITVSANASGGVMGKMISPQSLAVGAAAVGLVGKESDLFRFGVKHSFILLLFICILVTLQTYVIKWIVPVYQIMEGGVKAVAKDLPTGYFALTGLAVVIAVIFVTSLVLNRKKG
jgi:lactate permease